MHDGGLPWWFREESALQHQGPGFNPWSGKIPDAMEQLSPGTTAIEARVVDPANHSKRSHSNEIWLKKKPKHCNLRANTPHGN